MLQQAREVAEMMVAAAAVAGSSSSSSAGPGSSCPAGTTATAADRPCVGTETGATGADAGEDSKRLLASLERRLAQEARCRADAERLLEAERARVLDLERRLQLRAAAPEADGGGESASAAAAELAARQKEAAESALAAERAAHAEVRRQLEAQLTGVGAMLGDVYDCYTRAHKENRELHLRAIHAERVRDVAKLKLEIAVRAERLAQGERTRVLAAGLGSEGGLKPAAGPETGARGDAAGTTAASPGEGGGGEGTPPPPETDHQAAMQAQRLQRVCDLRRIEHLQQTLAEVERRADEMAALLRGGPFRFARGW